MVNAAVADAVGLKSVEHITYPAGGYAFESPVRGASLKCSPHFYNL